MTTDVINAPRELLRDAMQMLEAHSPGSGSVESYAAQDIQALLATAQPAADGEREAAPGWAHWAAGDTVRYVSSGGFIHARMTVDSDYLIHEAPDDCESMLVLDDDGDELSVLVGEFEWQARAAQPQQAVAVTDEMRRLREALERVKLTEKEARHHSVSTVAYWNNAVTACISVLAAQGEEVGE